MTDTTNTAITCAFMWQGLAEDDTLLGLWGKGCYELVYEVAQFADLSERMIEAYSSVCEREYPGVYDYDVSQPFGEWLRAYIVSRPSHDIDRANASRALQLSLLGFFFREGDDKTDGGKFWLAYKATDTARLQWLKERT